MRRFTHFASDQRAIPRRAAARGTSAIVALQRVLIVVGAVAIVAIVIRAPREDPRPPDLRRCTEHTELTNATPVIAAPMPTAPMPATPMPATPMPATPMPATPMPATPTPATPTPATPTMEASSGHGIAVAIPATEVSR